MPMSRFRVGSFFAGALCSWLWFALGNIVVDETTIPAYRAAVALLGPLSPTGPFMYVLSGVTYTLAALPVALLLSWWVRGGWLASFGWFVFGLAIGIAIQMPLLDIDASMLLVLLQLPAFWAPLVVTAAALFIGSRIRSTPHGA